MIEQIINHVWQSTLFVIGVALLSMFFQRSRAQVRYWLWFSASLKFLLPFAALIAFGRQLEWAPAVRSVASPAVSAAVAGIGEPFTSRQTVDVPKATPRNGLREWAIALVPFVWGIGCLGIAIRRIRSWQRVSAAVKASTPFHVTDANLPLGAEVRSAPGLLEPGVVGWRHPILLLPAGLEAQLTPQQLRAIVAHEATHIRRRDNATAAIHMMVETLFWFHPLVWWIGARLLDERERACDEEVLSMFDEPEAYAEGILAVCKRYVETPLACVSGVSGSNIKQRLETIMSHRIGIQLGRAGKMLIALAAGLAVTLPIVVGALTPRQAQAPAEVQSDKKFEEASIRPCTQEIEAPAGQRGGGSNSFRMTPGRTYVQCMTLATIIRTAWSELRSRGEGEISLAGDMRMDAVYGLGVEKGVNVRGGPDWVHTDKYAIEAIGVDTATAADMSGPMLRELLEQRFQLKVHIESEPIDAFELKVAPGGLKIKPMPEECARGPVSDELKTRRNGNGAPILVTEAARLGVKPSCGVLGGRSGPNMHIEHVGKGFGGLTLMVAMALDPENRMNTRVVDRTGVTDSFAIVWEFGPDESTPGALREMERDPGGSKVPGWDGPENQSKAPPLSVALAQLGLKVDPIKVPREFIVIDRVARPSPN